MNQKDAFSELVSEIDDQQGSDPTKPSDDDDQDGSHSIQVGDETVKLGLDQD